MLVFVRNLCKNMAEKIFIMRIINRIYYIVFNLTLSLTILQYSCPIVSYLTKVRFDYLGMLILGIILMINVFTIGIKPFFMKMINILKPAKNMVLIILFYFVIDSINLIYAQDISFVIDKYLIWAKIGFICIYMFSYMCLLETNFARDLSNDIILNIGITGSLSSFISLIGYYSGEFTYTKGILTPISNQNVFAISILIGYVSLTYYILLNNNLRKINKIVLLSLISWINISVIYLSGSRRTIILLFVLSALFLFYLLYKAIMMYKNFRSILFSIICLLLVIVLIISHINFFNSFTSSKFADSRLNIADSEIKPANNQKIVGAKEYVDTISEGTGLSTRIIIWKASLNWFSSMATTQKIFGGGASYQTDIFNDLEHPINSEVVTHYEQRLEPNVKQWMWPHNFIFDELLTGGIFKLLIVITTLVLMLAYVIILFRQDINKGIIVLILYFILFSTLMMSAKFGLFGDRNSWLIVSYHIIALYTTNKEGRVDVDHDTKVVE